MKHFLRRLDLFRLYSLLLCLFAFHFLSANEASVVYTIKIHKEISPTTRIYLSKGLQEAQALDAKAVIIDMNTYGGTVVDADSMRSSILYSPIPVYTFINNNAASAGALIALASKKIFMVKGAAIGAATVVGQTGEQAPDKYQSYMRGIIKSTAESHGKDTIVSGTDTSYVWKRDPRIAEAMVDERVHIPLINDSGRVITFTSEEAMTHRYCDAIVTDVDQIIREQLKIPEYKLVTYQPTWFENTKGFLLNPVLQAILIMIIIGGIYFELQSPGIGFPSIAALAAVILYFTPLWMDGAAQYWEIILFVIGVILIALEIFVVPGFGITGISGIILCVGGLTLALLGNNDFDFQPVEIPDISHSLLTVMTGILLGFGLVLLLASRIGEKGIFNKIALHKNIDSTIVNQEEKLSLIGKSGETMTALRPSGKAFIDGEVYDAISVTGIFIEARTSVKVVRQEAAQIYVTMITIK